ncbi:hypothetical protein LINGRAHAP2_LOCUS4495, partial [Linum grandiflorum]
DISHRNPRLLLPDFNHAAPCLKRRRISKPTAVWRARQIESDSDGEV